MRIVRATLIGLLAAACGDEPAGPGDVAGGPDVVREGIAYAARLTAARPDLVEVEVGITNRASAPETIRFPDTCVVLLRAYFPSSARLAWDQQDGKTGCQAQPVEVEVACCAERTFSQQISSIGILGHTLPEGEYRIAAYLRPVGAAEIELGVGTVRLERP